MSDEIDWTGQGCSCLLDSDDGEIAVLDSECSRHGFTIHIAGPQIVFGTLVRQRCAWCGEVIQEHDGANAAVQTDPTASQEVQQHEANEVIYGTRWQGLVAVQNGGGQKWSIEEPEDGKAPPESCMQRSKL